MKFDIKKKHMTKSRLVWKLLICYIVILLLLVLFSITFIAKSASLETSPDLVNKQSDSVGDSSVLDDKQSDSVGDSSVLDDKQSDSVIYPLVIDDKQSDSVGDSSVLSDAETNEQLVIEEEIVSMTTYEMKNLSSGEEKEALLENSEEISICSIDFTAAANLSNVNVTVIKLKDKPEEIIEPPKNISVYKYLDIKLTADNEYVEENNIKLLKFKFKVAQIWITDNNIDKLTIILIRYHDGEWQNLTTIHTSEDDTYVYYEAGSSGCSTFAVVGSKVVEKEEAFKTDEPEIPWIFIIGFIIAAILTLLIFLFKARYIYIEEIPEE